MYLILCLVTNVYFPTITAPTSTLPSDLISPFKTTLFFNVVPEFSWHYVRCPPENECTNGHHTCSPKSEKCFDSEEGFECMCGDGYKTET